VGIAVSRCGRGKEGGGASERRKTAWQPGPACQRAREGGGGARAGREANGPSGPKGKKASFSFFLFFQTFSNSNFFLFKFKLNSFKLFFQKFYKLFRSHTSNQKPCKANWWCTITCCL
jgi:hypothetical protein